MQKELQTEAKAGIANRTNIRWKICALLFLATMVNYIDRNVLSFIMLDEDFKRDMLGLASGVSFTAAHENEFKEMMGYVNAAFKFAYASGFILMGWLIDKIGTFRGYSAAILMWVGAAISHGFVSGVKSLSMARIILGIGEAGNFPSAIKIVAEWFPKKERAFATGLFNAGANFGIIFTAFCVPMLVNNYGWRTTFFITSSMGGMLFILWRIFYKKPEEHKEVNSAELSYIRSDQEESTDNKTLSWRKLFPYKQTWAIIAGKFFTDCIWYFYIFWLPTFFAENDNFELDLKPSFQSIEDVLITGLPFLIIYLVSDLGSILFGWLSSYLIKTGYTVNTARKITMLVCATCVAPIFLASLTTSVVVAVGLIALAAAAHQGWSANVYTLASDMFPKNAVASVVGIGSMFGAIGAMIFAASTGIIIKHFGYFPLFAIASANYFIALIVTHILAPRLKSAEV